MSVTHYLSGGSGHCTTRQLQSAHGSITQTLDTGVFRTWDTENLGGLSVNSGTWSIKLWMLLDTPGGSPEDVTVSLLRKNSSCVTQESIFFVETITVTQDTPTLHTLSGSKSAITFNVGDVLELQVRHENQQANKVLISFDSSARNSRVEHPDTGIGETLAAAIAALSALVGTVSDDNIVLSIGALSALTGTLVSIAEGSAILFGTSLVSGNVEGGVFLSSLITASTTFSNLLDVILEPFPEILPIDLKRRARWAQFKFTTEGDYDVQIPGFLLYVVTSGQMNVEET